MLKIYISPEVTNQNRDNAGNILFAIQNANTYKPLSFSVGGDNSAVASFTAVKVSSKGVEKSRTSLSTSIIEVLSAKDIYKVTGEVVYASLLDEEIYYFEFQNASNLYYSEYFLVQAESIFLKADNNYYTADSTLQTADQTKTII